MPMRPEPDCSRHWTGLVALLAAMAFGVALGVWLNSDAASGMSWWRVGGLSLLLSAAVLVLCIRRVYRNVSQDAVAVSRLREALAESHAEEQRLQRQEHLYHAILEESSEMICHWYPDGHISYVNEAYCRYFQVSREELLRQDGFPLFHPGTDRLAASLYREKPVVVTEFPVQYPDGTQRWQRWVDRVLFNDDGSIREFQSIGEDITTRKHTEEEANRLLEENRRLAHMALAIQEEERANLARELHDELGQALTAIRAEAECIRQINRERSSTINECAQAINTVAGQVYGVVRDMMHRLRPDLLDDFGLVEALHELLRQCRSHHPELVVEAKLDPVPSLSSSVALAVYRIVQEALTNIVKHAGAARVELVVSVVEDMLELRVRDDGLGIKKRVGVSGFGLLGMRERALGVGGEFNISTGPAMGTTIRVTLPLTAGGGEHGR